MAAINTKQPLTKRQAEVAGFISDFHRQKGFGPSVREIGLAFEISSPNGVMCHVRALERKGAITVLRGQARGIVPTNRSVRVKCPCCGEKFDHLLK